MDSHIGSHIFYEDLYRSDRITTYVVPFVIGMLLARDSIVGIQYLVQSLGPLGRTSSYAQCDQGVDHGMMCYGTSKVTSLFTHFVIHHLATNSLVVMLARLM